MRGLLSLSLSLSLSNRSDLGMYLMFPKYGLGDISSFTVPSPELASTEAKSNRFD